MKIYRTLMLAGVGLAAMAAPALAQNATPANGQSLATPPVSNDTGVVADSQIIVQARRRDERLQDVPLVVNAVTEATLQKDNIRNFQDITTVVPGLTLQANANGIGSSSSIRGVNHDVNVSGNNGTIQYYLNDAPVGSDVIFQTLFDVNSIDVERGPQGTLRGRAAPSGAIAVTTHQPNLREAGVFVDGTVASHDAKNVTFGIGVPIIRDMLAVRVAGVYDTNRGDRVTSVNDPSIKPENTTKALRASVRFEPTDWLKANFSYTTLNHENVGFDQVESFSLIDSTKTATAGVPSYGTIGLGQRQSVEFTNRDSVQQYKRYDWHLTASFAGQSLIYVGSHLKQTYNVSTPQDVAGIFPGLTTQLTQHTSSVTSDDTHEIRLQNESRLAGMFDYVIGYFHEQGPVSTNLTQGQVLQYQAGTSGFNIAPRTTTTVSVVLPESRKKEESFFGNLTMHLGEKAEISGGVRHIKYTDPGQPLFVNGGLTSPATPANGHPTIYNITAQYHFTNAIMAYASTGSSWRPAAHAVGDFSLNYSSNEQTFTNSPPETSKNYEIGLKSEWLRHKLLFNLTYYHQDYKNYPFRLAGNGSYYINYAAAGPTVGFFNFISPVPVKVDGVESEIAFSPSHHFSIDATFNYSKSKLSGGAAIPCDNLPAGLVPTLAQLQAALPAGQHVGSCAGSGLSATFQPKVSGTVTAEYSHAVNDTVEGFVRGIANWRGSSQNDPLNVYDNVGAYALINAYIGVRDAKAGWALTLYGKNVANLAKVSTLNGQPTSLSETTIFLRPPTYRTVIGTGSATFQSNYTGVTVTQPREFGVNLRVAFGSR
jgi:iron complex outermembrane receptor protein